MAISLLVLAMAAGYSGIVTTALGVGGRSQRRRERAARHARPAPAGPPPRFETPTVDQLEAIRDGLRQLT